MKSLLTVVIVTCLATGCNSEQSEPAQQKTVTTPDTKPQVDPPVLVPDPDLPTEPEPPALEVPSIPLEPSTPVKPPEPTLPTFIGEGITTHTQHPYTGTGTRDGDAYLRYNQDATTMDKFELPEWEVDYKYESFLELVVSNGAETLCARYSWKKGGFGLVVLLGWWLMLSRE
ncbi:membrane lipoprotein [Vibrio phage 1.223.O._10N.261.48.A9]|nr:membrane lipoprotein [Vibrio phage 1.223.O._10N.261.48.A9]